MPLIDAAFWSSFWANALSTLLVGILFTGIVAALISRYRTPKLEIRADFAHGPSKKLLEFTLSNSGNSGLMPYEGHWFIYIEFNLMPKGTECRGIILDGEPYWVLEGFNKVPIHPNSAVHLTAIEVRVMPEFSHDWLDQAKMFCAITTNRGPWKPSRGLFHKAETAEFVDNNVKRKLYRIEKVTQ